MPQPNGPTSILSELHGPAPTVAKRGVATSCQARSTLTLPRLWSNHLPKVRVCKLLSQSDAPVRGCKVSSPVDSVKSPTEREATPRAKVCNAPGKVASSRCWVKCPPDMAVCPVRGKARVCQGSGLTRCPMSESSVLLGSLHRQHPH